MRSKHTPSPDDLRGADVADAGDYVPDTSDCPPWADSAHPEGARQELEDNLLRRATELLSEASPVEWVLPGLLPRGSVVVVAGLPKAAKKTWLMLFLALMVARGSAFLGFTTTRMRVVYAFLEDGVRRAALRLKMLGLAPDEDVEFFTLHDAKNVSKLLQLLRTEGRATLLFIDPLVILERAFGVEDENTAMEIEKLFAEIRSFAQDTGSTVVIVHHFRKAGDTMRGSIAIQGSADGWWDLKRGDDGTVGVYCTLRDAEDSDFAFTMTEEEGDRIRFDLAETAAGQAEAASISSACAAVLTYLKSQLPRTASRRQITTAVQTTESLVARALRALEARGEVHRPDGPRSGYAAREVQP